MSANSTNPWIEERRRNYNGGEVHGDTSRPQCAVCHATPKDLPSTGMIGLCVICDSGPFCDICAEQHESTTKHPAMAD